MVFVDEAYIWSRIIVPHVRVHCSESGTSRHVDETRIISTSFEFDCELRYSMWTNRIRPFWYTGTIPNAVVKPQTDPKSPSHGSKSLHYVVVLPPGRRVETRRAARGARGARVESWRERATGREAGGEGTWETRRSCGNSQHTDSINEGSKTYHHGRQKEEHHQGSQGSQEARRLRHQEQGPVACQYTSIRDKRTRLTAREGGAAAPRPAGRATPGPAARLEEMPPGALLPRRALGSAGGSDSTDKDTICAPRTMVRPNVRFSSVSMVWPLAPGAAGLFCLRLIRRNSSVSARTRFMCYESVSVCRRWWDVDRTDLVESKHLSCHLPAIIESDPHPIVDLRCASAVPFG